MAKNKQRLDNILVERGHFATRQKAQAAIMSGIVYVENNRAEKAGQQVAIESEITIKGESCPYVSRGGYKLEKALQIFSIDLSDRVCLDAGASTGGFTDCLLQKGASKVYAVDVGYGQLDWKLRNDQRVIVLERTNIRHLKPEELYSNGETEKATLCVADLSFISLTVVMENILTLLDENKQIITLIKPQFEAGRSQVPKSGVVKDQAVHEFVIERICSFCHNLNLKTIDLTHSPVKGPSGNIEYLACFSSFQQSGAFDIAEIVQKAHQELN